MSRLFLSASLGVAMALSSVASGFAATTATGLISELQGTGVNTALVTAAQSSCSSGSSSQCIQALQTLLRALPANLPPAVVAQVTEYVTTTAGSRADVVASPQLVSLNNTLDSLGASQVTGSVTPDDGAASPGG
ncbi:hypothetical protein [Pleomorphomonas sp. JP5]|uniref:hypothetical protein n=1 Tax=Pleomorphomonas sp. JP5 TaxID=2942998 RepID=UPI0020433DD3|nr:hypothetical protein [Pleomorphomonas sp. JP5]MCM5556467.1 hypothetical protein [Pleomorphomonas sp. JP5]